MDSTPISAIAKKRDGVFQEGSVENFVSNGVHPLDKCEWKTKVFADVILAEKLPAWTEIDRDRMK